MAKNVRQRMINGAHLMLAQRGLQRTSFTEVTQATQTPRGSIYHHFPGGKQELVAEALNANCELFSASAQNAPTSSPQEFVAGLVATWRGFVVAQDFTAGCAVAAVTVGYENDAQLDLASQSFDRFLNDTTEGLVNSGLTREVSQNFAYHVVAVLEGATVLARAKRAIEPFDAACAPLAAQAEALGAA